MSYRHNFLVFSSLAYKTVENVTSRKLTVSLVLASKSYRTSCVFLQFFQDCGPSKSLSVQFLFYTFAIFTEIC